MNKKIHIIFILLITVLMLRNLKSEELSFLSFNSKEMISFNLSFKQYIAAYKGKFIEPKKGLKSLKDAIKKWNILETKALKYGYNKNIIGRILVIKGLFLQAYGLAEQNRFEESREISIPIRSEIFELHRTLNILTSEDYIIYFHNGILHRIEPLIEKKSYFELRMFIPIIKKYLMKFKNPPLSAKDIKVYKEKFSKLSNHIEKFIQTINYVNNFVDPEYGAFQLEHTLKKEFNTVHKIFGELYLSFPEGVIWPKTHNM